MLNGDELILCMEKDLYVHVRRLKKTSMWVDESVGKKKTSQGRHFNFFLGGRNFFIFLMPPDY